MDAWRQMTAGALGAGIAAGEIDPVELCDAYLDAIEAHPLKDRIYARVTPDRARSEAEAARKRARSGQRRSPLDGVPVSWKDLFDSAGVATEAGSRVLKGRVPMRDAKVLEHATRLGLVCLGKTHLSELAFSGLGYNPMTATPPCINDNAAVAGGSSSGAAASVAFGLAAAAIGSDTGGSVRVPAAWNDLVGVKTTHGLLSTVGAVPLCRRFDTVGPLSCCVDDGAALMHALGGPRVDLNGATLKGARFAVVTTIALDDLDDAVATAFENAVARLQDGGATIDRIAFDPLEDAFAVAGQLYTAEAYAEWHDAVENQADQMFGEIVDRIMGGKSVTAHDFIAGWRMVETIRSEWARRFACYDAVLCPTAPILPPNLQRLKTDSAYYKTANLATLRNTRIGNLMGLCAVTLPAGRPSTGICLNALAGQDARLLRLAKAAENALT